MLVKSFQYLEQVYNLSYVMEQKITFAISF